MPDKELAIFDQDTGETAEQHLWIELNREWLIRQHLYKSKRTKDEADLILYMLFHGCREIRRPPGSLIEEETARTMTISSLKNNNSK